MSAQASVQGSVQASVQSPVRSICRRLLCVFACCVLLSVVGGVLTTPGVSAAPAEQMDAASSPPVITRTVDSGYNPSLVLNSSGLPVMAYATNPPINLTAAAFDTPAIKLAVCNDAACTSRTINTVTPLGGVPYSLDLKLAAGNIPVISYNNPDAGDALTVARCTDALCAGGAVTNTVYGGTADSISLALDSAGNPRIAFYDYTNAWLRLAACGDPTCSPANVIIRTVDYSADVGQYASLALNSAGNPVIGYYDATNGDLKLAVCSDAACTSVSSDTVDTAGDVGQYASLALDSAGNPVISYYDAANADLKVALCGNPTCASAVTKVLDNGDDAGQNSALALAGDGHPVIAYQDSFVSALKVAVCSDAACAAPTITTLAPDGVFEWGPSLALAADKPVAAYDNYGSVELAVCTTTDCRPAPLTYPVTYNANGATGGSPPANQVKTHDVPLTLQTNSGGLVKTGMVFGGWNTQADGGGANYDPGSVYSTNAPLALYARWLYAVRNTADSGAGSLRGAVAEAAPGATLYFDPQLAGQTITFGSQIVLDKSITISATVPIILSGNNATRLFRIVTPANTTVHLYGLTLRNGKADKGGAIYNEDNNLWIENSAILNNVAQAGGGIYLVNNAETYTALIQNSTLAGNRADVALAGQAAAPALALAGVLGLAAVLGVGSFQPTGCLKGGGSKRRRLLLPFLGLPIFILLVGSACTVGATNNAGGAIYVESGVVTVSFSTLAHNEAGQGAAIFTQFDWTANGPMASGLLLINNSVVSQNTSQACFSTANISSGHNVVSDGSCGFSGPGDRNNVGPQVGDLQPDGTAPLLPYSVAIASVPANCPLTDQLGAARSAPCEAGALKFGGTAQARLFTTLTADTLKPYQDDQYTYTATVENRGAAAATVLKISLPLPDGLAYVGTPTWTAGFACTWAAPTLTCATPLPRDGVFGMAVPVQVTTDAVSQLTATAGAEAAAPVTSSAASFIVTSRGPKLPEVGPGRAYRTIQEAVNAVAPGATILVYPDTYIENVTVNKNLTIRGVEGAGRTIVDGSRKGSVFVIAANVNVRLDALTVRNGSGTYTDRAGIAGGGVCNLGNLTIDNSVVSGNTAFNGAGVHNVGTMMINSSIISSNSADNIGGGIVNMGALTIYKSAIDGNSGAGGGGGIVNYLGSKLLIENSTISGNIGRQSWGGGGIFHWAGDSLTIINTTITGNSTSVDGGGIRVASGTLTVRNSVIVQNQAAREPGISSIYGTGSAAISNSVLQDSGPAGNGNVVGATDGGFVRNPGTNGVGDYGDLHLKLGSLVTYLGRNCPATDRDGKTRDSGSCSAGAYEFQAATAGGVGMAALDAAAEQAASTFSSSDGPVRLATPTGAVTQTVHLAFSLGAPTGGDGRTHSVVFTPYDAAGSLLEQFSFLQPATLTLAYDPALVNRGLDIDLLPMRLEPLTGSWLPFTRDVVVDQTARTVTFPILQAGEYGLFSVGPGVHVELAAASPAGTANLAGGASVTYTLAVFNNGSGPLQNLTLTHTLPQGLAFTGWVQANGATLAGRTVTWNIPILAGGGLQAASFAVQVSGDAAYYGKAITGTLALTGPGGLSAGGEAVVSVNGPPTAVDDSATTRPGEAITLWPLLNDLNPDGSPLHLVGLGSPAHGSAAIVGKMVVYTPTAGFTGTDTFGYQVRDGQFNVEGAIHVRAARLAFLGVLQTVSYNGQRGMMISDVPQNGIVEYTLDLYNNAEGEIAQNVVLTDALPSGVQFTSWITQSGALLEGSTIRWSAGSVPTNTLITISFRARVVAAAGEVVTNTASAAAANADPAAAGTMITVGGEPEPLRLYLPLLQREAAVMRDSADAPGQP